MMDRRKFLVRGTIAAGGAAAVKQAIAQTPSLPSIRWRCASSFPKSLDTIFGGGEVVAKRVEHRLSSNRDPHDPPALPYFIKNIECYVFLAHLRK